MVSRQEDTRQSSGLLDQTEEHGFTTTMREMPSVALNTRLARKTSIWHLEPGFVLQDLLDANKLVRDTRSSAAQSLHFHSFNETPWQQLVFAS